MESIFGNIALFALKQQVALIKSIVKSDIENPPTKDFRILNSILYNARCANANLKDRDTHQTAHTFFDSYNKDNTQFLRCIFTDGHNCVYDCKTVLDHLELVSNEVPMESDEYRFPLQFRN